MSSWAYRLWMRAFGREANEPIVVQRTRGVAPRGECPRGGARELRFVALPTVIVREGTTVVVRPPPQLVVGSRQRFKADVEAELAAGARTIVVDFAETTYVDSSGLGVLITLANKVRAAGGAMHVRNLTDDFRTLFELTKLDTLFTGGPAGGT